jgi:hypothetical protein
MTTSLKDWVINHDDKKIFTYLYIGSAVVLSIAVSLFWLIVVVGIHLGFETYKQYQIDQSWIFAVLRSTWEVLLDLSLIIFSFVLVLYLDVVLGAAGIGVAARVGVQAASGIGVRFAGFQRAIRGILLSIDDILQISKSFLKSKKQESTEDSRISPLGGWVGKWTFGDSMTIVFLVVSASLIFVSPVLLDENLSSIIQKIVAELHPLGN